MYFLFKSPKCQDLAIKEGQIFALKECGNVVAWGSKKLVLEITVKTSMGKISRSSKAHIKVNNICEESHMDCENVS